MLAVLPSSNNFSMVFALDILGLCFGFYIGLLLLVVVVVFAGLLFFFMAQGMADFFPKYFRHVQERT